jgi:hypothetical protein
LRPGGFATVAFFVGVIVAAVFRAAVPSRRRSHPAAT